MFNFSSNDYPIQKERNARQRIQSEAQQLHNQIKVNTSVDEHNSYSTVGKYIVTFVITIATVIGLFVIAQPTSAQSINGYDTGESYSRMHYVQLAISYYTAQDYEMAMQILNTTLISGNDFLPSYIVRSATHYQMGQYELALDDALHAMELHYGELSAHYLAAQSACRLNRPDTAKFYYDTYLILSRQSGYLAFASQLVGNCVATI